jgi:hypothetical protein
MLKNQVNKYSSTNQEASSNKVEESRSPDRRDDHGGSRLSRSISRHQHHHYPRKLTRKKMFAFKVRKNPKYISYQESEKETWVR